MFSRFFKTKPRQAPTIYFRHHCAGLINQVMSVELAFGLAHMENSHLHIYNIKHTEEMPVVISGVIPDARYSLYEGSARPSVFDLLDLPSSVTYTLDSQKEIDSELLSNCTSYNNLLIHYYCCQTPSKDEESFADQRHSLKPETGKDLHLHNLTFSFYSRFFYKRPASLDRLLAGLRFQAPYQELARKIAERIGRFRGLHFRLTDHAKNYDASKATLARSMQYYLQRDIPLIVSTDDKETVNQLLGIPCLFIDDIIQSEFGSDFMSLPFHDEVVFGMICLLVMAHSEEFVGTPGSTFSSYIHRLRVLRGAPSKHMHYFPAGNVENANALGQPYSWNNSHISTEMKSWWREWPECQLQV